MAPSNRPTPSNHPSKKQASGQPCGRGGRGLSDEFLRSLGLVGDDATRALTPVPVPPSPPSSSPTSHEQLTEGSVIGVEDVLTGAGWLVGRYTASEVLPDGRYRMWLAVPPDVPTTNAILVAYDYYGSSEWRAPFGRRVRLWLLLSSVPSQRQPQAQP